MTFSDFNSHTNPLFIDLKLIKVTDVIKLHQLKLVYEFCKQTIPTDLQNLFTFSSDIHTTNLVLNSAHKNFIHIPSIKTVTYGNKSIKFHCAKLWNDTFRKGIAIDNVAKNNVVFDKIFDKHHLKRVLKKHYLYSYSLLD